MSKSPTKDVIDLSYIFDEDFMNLFNGKENIFGTNTEFLCKQKKKIESKINKSNHDKKKIIDINSELGLTHNGKKKPKTCWNFVKNGFCNHYKNNENQQGLIIKNFYHPGIEERNYLYSKIKK